ncbi:pantoate--beta-alanine ligase [Thalassoroseus pseudoceratinae]|uniref:pantoate--beta-alanine ligase n=1 Tax=Thalassoroseus pseudoceratinae TaxID=2713176 RepID=UPI00198008F7|nr:pantoate--beta-alanine ligase [Thalassoroseus pseudoceratinae]
MSDAESRELMVLEQPDAVRARILSAQRQGERVGLVPTMGALHAGHLRLVEEARKTCDFVVVTIFVNPTQFGPQEDLEQYPRPFQDDLEKCRAAGVDVIFHPTPEVMYPPEFQTTVSVGKLARVWEGAHRPDHFDGVTTVVLKLFSIAPADVAFFGRKDYQQQLIIRRMVRDLNLPIEIETVETVREADGLALSSRNVYLSPDERRSALILSESLQLADDQLAAGETDVSRVRQAMHDRFRGDPQVNLDYATIADPHTLIELTEAQLEMVALVAARVGQTRLIDNRLIHLS